MCTCLCVTRCEGNIFNKTFMLYSSDRPEVWRGKVSRERTWKDRTSLLYMYRLGLQAPLPVGSSPVIFMYSSSDIRQKSITRWPAWFSPVYSQALSVPEFVASWKNMSICHVLQRTTVLSFWARFETNWRMRFGATRYCCRRKGGNLYITCISVRMKKMTGTLFSLMGPLFCLFQETTGCTSI